MWQCDDCGAAGTPDGFRATVGDLEYHLINSACMSGWYSYGGRKADRTSVNVCKVDGKVLHALNSTEGWKPTTREEREALLPRPFRVLTNRIEYEGTVTLALAPLSKPIAFEPGQFSMLGVPEVGEVPISFSGDPRKPVLDQTVRAVGGITRMITFAAPGDILNVRGPFGRGWNASDAAGLDLVMVAGGCGLAPLRPAIIQAISQRVLFNRVVLLYGAPSPEQQMYRSELTGWWPRANVEVRTIFDSEGMVTELIPRADFSPSHAVALICGPEPMMHATSDALLGAGMPPGRVRVSLERHMKCGIGLCGHCHVRKTKLVCTDGPVFTIEELRRG